MTSSRSWTRSPVSRRVRAAIAAALLLPALEEGAYAQANDDPGGFAVRRLNLSTGYASVHLPPLTLGGILPNDVLNADLITSGSAEIDWRRVTPRTEYTLDLSGLFTARTRYSQLSAPGGDLALGVSRTVGNRWRLGAAVDSAITSADQLAFQPTQAGRLVEDAGSFDDLAGTVVFARSPDPDLAQAALFLPIRQSVAASDLDGSRIMASTVKAAATYAHSARLATSIHGNYTIVRRISSSNEPAQLGRSPDSNAETAGVGIRYDRSERSQVRTGIDWSRTTGDFTDDIVLATVGYAWSGQRWFTEITGGAALRPARTMVAAPVTTIRDRTPAIIWGGSIGYKFRAQTLLVQYRRASHDEYGHGGRNIATGFEGNVQSAVGSWSWSAPRSRWMARSDFSMLRGPGNFTYIYAWLSTIGIGHQLGPSVSLMGELLFDRHGSRAFEGFSLTRRQARLTLTWTPHRRKVG
jgi:hypothetical protein